MTKEHNDEPECMDRLIDVFLEEMLTGRKPPDLSERILAAHRAELETPQGPSSTPVDSVTASVPSVNEIGQLTGNGRAFVIAVPIQPGSHVQPGSHAVTNSHSHSGLGSTATQPDSDAVVERPTFSRARQYERQGWLAFALAVCAVGVVVILGFVRGQQSLDTSVTAGTSEPSDGLGSTDGSSVDTSSQPMLAEDGLRDSAGPRLPVGEVLTLDDVPFGKSRVDLVIDSPAMHSDENPVVVLAADEVAAGIDKRLAALWQQLEVTPTKSLPAEGRLARLQSVLTGNPADAGSALAIEMDGGIEFTFDQVSQLLDQELRNGRFSDHWAELFVKTWLGTRQSESTQGTQALERWLAQQIAERRPWNQVALELLDAPLPDEKGEVMNPQSMFLANLAGGENHRLVEKIGTSFLNANFKCVRCHDGQGVGRPGSNQATYWSLVASLKGIDAGGSEDNGRWAVDKQQSLFSDSSVSQSVFFDRPDGVLQAAEARVPGGQLWTDMPVESPRQALAVWISNSTQFSDATVNNVWRLMFGKPLAPLSSNVELAGYDQRRELLQYLSAQFKAHDYDLTKLVGWIASTKAFGLEPIRLNHAEWLALSPGEIDGRQLSELVFAAGPTAAGTQPIELDTAVDAVVRWSNRSGPVETLAQPNLQASAAAAMNSAQLSPNDLARLETDSGFLLHATRPTVAQKSFVSRLLRAKLSWEERVEHVVGLSEHEMGTQRVQHLAKVLLEASNGDSRTALLHLLWCVQRQGSS